VTEQIDISVVPLPPISQLVNYGDRQKAGMISISPENRVVSKK